MPAQQRSDAAAPAADPLIDERVCLALHLAARAMTARYRPLLDPLGLTYPQFLVLSLLWEDGPASVGAIGVRLGLDSSTLSPLLKRLEGQGLVDRGRSSADERVTVVSLTTAGKRLRRRTAHVPRTICDATGMSDRDLARLVRQLRGLSRTLGDDAG